MSEQYPADWITLHCPKGHIITSYQRIEIATPWEKVDLSGVCEECGTPWMFRGHFDSRWAKAESVPLPPDPNAPPIDPPPFVPFDGSTQKAGD